MEHKVRMFTDEQGENQVEVTATCIFCLQPKILVVPLYKYALYKGGSLVQRALTALNDADREILITGICGTCFDKLFSEDEF